MIKTKEIKTIKERAKRLLLENAREDKDYFYICSSPVKYPCQNPLTGKGLRTKNYSWSTLIVDMLEPS